MSEEVVKPEEKDAVMSQAFGMVRKMGIITDTMINTVVMRLRLPKYSKEVELFIDQDSKSIECIYHIQNIEDAEDYKKEAISYANGILKEYFWEYEIKIRIRTVK